MNEKEKIDYIKANCFVSMYGDIYNLKTGYRFVPQIDKDGYKRLRIYKNREQLFKIPVHRVVALFYIDNPYNYPVVNHKDGNKQNNHKDNLEWCTVKENTLHAEKLGLRTHEHKQKKVKQLDTEGNTIAIYNSLTEASEKTGIARQCIGKCCNYPRLRKSAGGYKWETFND